MRWLVLAAVVLLMAACGDADPQTSADPTAPPTSAADAADSLGEDLMGDWVVDELVVAGQAVAAPNPDPATLLIEPGGLSGDAGCNRFFGEWSLDADGRLAVTSFAITEAGCIDRVDWMELVDTIQAATRLEGDAALLVLSTDAGDEVVLTRTVGPIDSQGGGGDLQAFEGPADAPDYLGLTEAEAAALADERGVSWRVAVIDGVPVPVTGDFDENRYNFAINNGIVEGVSLG